MSNNFVGFVLVLSAISWANANESSLILDADSSLSKTNIENALIAPSSEVEYKTAVELSKMMESFVRPTRSVIDAARAVCYSSLVGNNNHALIMVPLPSNASDLDAVCHLTINANWNAGGVAKSNNFNQDCDSLSNTDFGGGYTSYVTENYFEANRNNYPHCGPTNAMICCSPQHTN